MRVIFYVADVDKLYDRALAAGCQPTTAPRDAEWGERFFRRLHILPFQKRFEGDEKDETLFPRIWVQELPGILNHFLAGWRRLQQRGCFELPREAGAVYQAAADLDPLFAWHLNNFAWMAATSPDLRANDGQLAVTLAARACEISGWGYWCFLGTLAAAFARAGEFRRAAEWQRISSRLARGRQQDKARQMLRHFEAGEAYVDLDLKPAAGGCRPSRDEVSEINVQQLLAEAQKLIGMRRAAVQ